VQAENTPHNSNADLYTRKEAADSLMNAFNLDELQTPLFAKDKFTVRTVKLDFKLNSENNPHLILVAQQLLLSN
jgi:hypothetical protein